MTHFTLLAGLRFDKHNLIKNPIVSPRVNLLYRPFSALQARMTWSTGFRAPQAYDEDLHVTAVGGEAMIIRLAEGLKPERSNSFSASVDYDFRIGDVDADILAEGFYTELRDVFVLEALGSDAEGVMVKERRNGNGARVYGANIDLSFTYRSYDCAAVSQLSVAFTAVRSRGARIRMCLRRAKCRGRLAFTAILRLRHSLYAISNARFRGYIPAACGCLTTHLRLRIFLPIILIPSLLPTSFSIRRISWK